MKLHLGDVEETALIPLAVRANESKRKNARISDPKAVEIIDALGIDTRNLDKLVTHECVVARTILFDDLTKSYIRENPDTVCINLGCGLDDRFSRVDNGRITWYNVDLPDSIEVRKKVFEESGREKMIGCSILDEHWSDNIPKEKPVIVVAEGLLMYFSREQIATILNSLTASFSEGVLLVELMRQKMMKEDMHDTVKHTNATFGWGIEKTGRELTMLNDQILFVGETTFSEQMKKDSFLSRILGTIIGDMNNRLSVFEWRR